MKGELVGMEWNYTDCGRFVLYDCATITRHWGQFVSSTQLLTTDPVGLLATDSIAFSLSCSRDLCHTRSGLLHDPRVPNSKLQTPKAKVQSWSTSQHYWYPQAATIWVGAKESLQEVLLIVFLESRCKMFSEYSYNTWRPRLTCVCN